MKTSNTLGEQRNRGDEIVIARSIERRSVYLELDTVGEILPVPPFPKEGT